MLQELLSADRHPVRIVASIVKTRLVKFLQREVPDLVMKEHVVKSDLLSMIAQVSCHDLSIVDTVFDPSVTVKDISFALFRENQLLTCPHRGPRRS